MIAVAVSHAEH